MPLDSDASVTALDAPAQRGRPGIAQPRPRSRTRNLVAAGLVAAIMTVLGPVAITAGTVPVTLQIFPVVLAALLLPAEWAAGAMAVYVMLGAIGVPVYAHGTAGLGQLLGPTGGFLIGFIAGAGAGGLAEAALRRVSHVVADIAAAAVAIVAVYACGWAWLAFGPAHVGALKALVLYVAPFIAPDAVKAAVAILVAVAVRRGVSQA